MSDTSIPTQNDAEIRKAVKLLRMREEELALITRWALELRLREMSDEIRSKAEDRLHGDGPSAAAATGTREARGPGSLDPSQEDEVFEIEAAKRRARASEVGRLGSDPQRDSQLTEHLQGTGRASSPVAGATPSPGALASDPQRDSQLTEHLQGTGRASSPVAGATPSPGALASDPDRDSQLTEHLQGTGRVVTPKPKPKVKPLPKEPASAEVKSAVSERGTLTGKATNIGTGATAGSMRKKIGDKGVLEGLLEFFGAVSNTGEYDPEEVMKAVRLSAALGKSVEAQEFLKTARDHMDDVKRLMANRPADLKKLLVAGEFAAMKALVEQEVRSPSARLVGGPSGAHQFNEHGAHNSVVQLVLLSLSSGNPKSSWVSAAAEKAAVEWAEQKIALEVAALAGGNTAGADSIGWKGDIAGARRVITDNLGYPNPADRWTGPGGVRPTSWADFVGNSETFRSNTTFRWRHPDGTVGDTCNLGPVFNRNISELNVTGAAAGIAGNLASRKIKATAVNLPAAPVMPHAHPLLDDPEITLAQGGVYYYDDGGQWKEITLVVYADAPPIATFKAVFRKTNDAALSYKVYTAYPA